MPRGCTDLRAHGSLIARALRRCLAGLKDFGSKAGRWPGIVVVGGEEIEDETWLELCWGRWVGAETQEFEMETSGAAVGGCRLLVGLLCHQSDGDGEGKAAVMGRCLFVGIGRCLCCSIP